jgi:hypothetical protein
MGKPDDALQICNELKNTKPPIVDEAVLSTLYIVFRDLGRGSKIRSSNILYILGL